MVRSACACCEISVKSGCDSYFNIDRNKYEHFGLMFNVYAVAVWVLLSSREKKAVCGQQRANDTRGFNDVIGVNTLG